MLELYNHRIDPRENENVADRPENAELIEQLREKLYAGWGMGLPPDE